MRSLILSLLLLTLFASSCNLPLDQGFAPTPSIMPIAQATADPTSAIQASTATPRVPGAACPVELGAPSLPELSLPAEWAQSVLTYLNQGGSLTGLIEALPGLGQDDPVGSSAQFADLDGDGFEDFLISLAQLPDEHPPGSVPGILLVYLCELDRYRLVHAASASAEADRYHLMQVQDLTGDGIPEILAMQVLCGAHTCYQAWEILQWQQDQFVNVIAGRSDDLPSPQFEISGPREDGSMTFSLTSSSVSSAGAGPGRPTTRTWHWTSQDASFVVAEEHLAAPSFRIHAVHDADRAALENRFNDALAGYTSVIENPALDDYPFGEEGQVRLSAYALFRSMLLWIQSGDIDQAQVTYSFLQAAHPAGSPGHGFSMLAQEVWQTYQAEPNLEKACQAAQIYAQTHASSTLDLLYYGYANQSYVARDICPYGT